MDPDQLERAAESAHNQYLEDNKHKNLDPAMLPWDELSPDLKDSNLQQIAYMGSILATEGFGIRERTDKGGVTTFGKNQIKRMAEKEHGRYVVERLKKGWVYGTKRDPNNRISPYLVPWKDLPDDVQEYDRKAIRDFPKVLADAGLEIYDKAKDGE